MQFEFNNLVLDTAKPMYIYCYTYDVGNPPHWYPLTSSDIGRYNSKTSAKRFWITDLKFKKGTGEIIRITVEDDTGRDRTVYPNEKMFIGASPAACKKAFENCST